MRSRRPATAAAVHACQADQPLPVLSPPAAHRGREVALDLAEALNHLHTQLGILHSDLTPA
jgi:hypothetical protein